MTLSPNRTPFDVVITNGSTEITCVLAKDKQGNPLWQRGSAPPLSPTINTSLVSNATVPPAQGLRHTIDDVSGGAGAEHNQTGRYAFAENMYTRTGRAMNGPETLVTALTGGGALDGVIADYCEHNSTTYIAAGTKVYYWDTATELWVKTATDPVGNVKITKIQSFAGYLIVFMDNAPADNPLGTGKPYEYSADNGATWTVKAGAGRVSGKYSAIEEQHSLFPILRMVADPNVTFWTEDPTNTGSWSNGSKVGDLTNYDHFTSVVSSPSGEMLYGKEVGWRTMDAFSNVDMLYGPVQPDAGRGTENFAWPQMMGGRVYTVARDYDILEYAPNTTPRAGFGPRYHGPSVPEMQKPVVALATDQIDRLYVALGGSEGYIMDAGYQQGEWRYHGAIIKLGQAISRMWTASYALASNKNMWLWIAPSASPYLPYRALIPLGDYESDSDARYASTGNIRFGWEDAEQPDVTKILAQCLPTTKNLTAATRTVELQWREDGASSFTSLNTFSESPEPTSLSTTYFPASTNCKRFELKAVFTNSVNTEVIKLESLVTLVFRRPLRLDTLDFTVLAETGMRSRMGGNSLLSAQGLKEDLWNARDSITPPTVTRSWDDLVWTVDILDIQETWVQASDAAVPVLAYRVSCLQLPTITSIVTQADGGTVAAAGVVCITGGLLAFALMTEAAIQDQEDIAFAGMTAAFSVA